ncbi:MAG: hypothetical protein ABIV47_10645 [Roseiflexaceae bacterium]
MANAGAGNAGMEADVGTKPGTTYKLTAWLKIASDSGANWGGFRFEATSWDWKSLVTSGPLLAAAHGNAWFKIALTFTAESAQTRLQSGYFGGPGRSQVVHVDDLALFAKQPNLPPEVAINLTPSTLDQLPLTQQYSDHSPSQRPAAPAITARCGSHRTTRATSSMPMARRSWALGTACRFHLSGSRTIRSASSTRSAAAIRTSFAPGWVGIAGDRPGNHGNYVNIEGLASQPDLRVFGQKDLHAGSAYAWINNQHDAWRAVVDGQSIPAVSGTVSIAMQAASATYSVTWYDTTTGQPAKTELRAADATGTLTLNISNLQTDMAVTITRTGQ